MVWAGDAAAYTLRCPAELPVAQDVAVFSGITVYDGRPEEMASLVPDDAEADLAQWTLKGKGFWAECNYRYGARQRAALSGKLPYVNVCYHALESQELLCN